MLNFIIKKNLTEISLIDTNDELKIGCFYNSYENTIEYQYIKNYCLKFQVSIELPNDIDLFKRICMMFSFNDFSFLKNNILIDHEFIGLVPMNSNNPVLFINIKFNDLNRKKYNFVTRKYKFEREVEALNIDEQIRLAFHMIYVYNTEKCEYIRKIKTQAYLDRLLFCENEKHFLLFRLCYYYESLINLETKYLENVIEQNYFVIDDYILKIPLIFRRDIEISLANIYFLRKSFEKSLEFYRKLRMIQEEIDCLINLKRNEEAIKKIKQQLEICKKDKILYCNYCIKLGNLTKNTLYFDLGYDMYKSFEPLKEKAIFLHKSNQFLEAKEAYEKVLKIVPQNESLLYGYASVKIVLKEYISCIDIFLRLIEMNKTNPEYHRNLALCYYNINNIKKCMESLKKNSLKDSTSLDFYFKLCVKEKNKEGILWYLQKIKDENFFNKLISYLCQEDYINKNEAKDCAKKCNFNLFF